MRAVVNLTQNTTEKSSDSLHIYVGLVICTITENQVFREQNSNCAFNIGRI